MTNNKIQAYAERIENVLNEIDELKGSIKDLYEEVKSAQFNPRALRKAIARRRRKTDEAFEAEVEAYSAMLTMPGATYRSVAEQTGISKSKLQRLVPREENGTAAKSVGRNSDETDSGRSVTSRPAPNSEESEDRQSPVRDGEASADLTTASASSSPPWPPMRPTYPDEPDLTIPAHLRRIA